MNILKQMHQHKVSLQPQYDTLIDLGYNDCVLYGFIFSSTGRCKVELMSHNGHENVILTTFNSQAQQNIELTLPAPLLIQGGFKMRIKNMEGQSVDGYVTTFMDDPYQAYSQQFTQSLEETLTR